jgi:hypothetical protein
MASNFQPLKESYDETIEDIEDGLYHLDTNISCKI